MRWGSAVRRPASSGDFKLNPTLPLQFRRYTSDTEAAPNFVKSGGLPRLEPQPSRASPLASLLSPPRQHLQPRHHPWLQLQWSQGWWADPPWFNNHLKFSFHKQGKLFEADCGGLHLQEGIQCLQQAARRRNSPWLGLCHRERVSRGGGNDDEGRKKSQGYFYPASR